MGWINSKQLDRDHNGQRDTCAGCGHEGTSKDPVVKATDGFRIHRSHTQDKSNGYYGQAQR